MSTDNPSIEDLLQNKKSQIEPGARGLKVPKTLHNLNRAFEERQTGLKAAELGYAYINLLGFPIDKESLALISKTEAETYKAVSFFHDRGQVRLGVLAPALPGLSVIRRHLEGKGYKVAVFLISQSSFQEALAVYDQLHKSVELHTERIEITDKTMAEKAERFRRLLDQKKFEVEKFEATDLLTLVLSAALKMDASDIHLEPENEFLHVRLRVDGVLQDLARLDATVQHKLVSRIKILAKLKLNIANMPQDGSFSISLNNKPVDLRVSVLPSIYGESVVMRILKQDKPLSLDELGVAEPAKTRLLAALKRTSGLILTTGPTGSGKTTTLYAILQILNKPGVKMITIEDPVEYKVPGISQTPIDRSRGMTFASGLRSILRQDPDIVMVGEIRDQETAEAAFQAALTGHTVLSTLHTNDAISTVPRLTDLQVKPFLITGGLTLGLAQRLVRRLCENCKQGDNPDEKILNKVENILKTIPPSAGLNIPSPYQFYVGKGCVQCHNLGYRGRIGIYETFAITPEMEKLILHEAPLSALRQQAINDGMVTMIQDGLLKALAGITDLYEVFRVTD